MNKFNAFGQNALQTHIACNESKDIAMLLYIAGETIDCSTVIKYAEDGEIIGQVEVPEYLFRRDLRLRLEHMCREAIRKHLIKVNNHSHLFSRTPQLPLPSALTQYLLYDMTVENDDDNNDGDDSSPDGIYFAAATQ